MQYIADVGDGMLIGIADVNGKWTVKTEKPIGDDVSVSTKTFTTKTRMLRYVTRKMGKLPFIEGLTDTMSRKTSMVGKYEDVVYFHEVSPEEVKSILKEKNAISLAGVK